MDKRKKYLINKKFQLKIIVMAILIVIVAIAAIGIFSYSMAVHIERESTPQSYGMNIANQDNIQIVERVVIRPIIVKIMLIGGIVCIIMAAVTMLFYSHRIAGPIYHLQKHLEKMIDGNYKEKLKFRKNDEFQYLVETVNKLQEKLLERQG